ncbi:MAG: class I SAM-dependent methyltransferase, partial [Ruminococcus sp.]|nr:class I SAM-dependent methyltransferase [Ruminococcus sp.]
MLDKRLQMCADMISGKGIVCDVGTDHAYLAVELIKSGKCEKVIASDVKEGPLESAHKTVEKYDVSDKVELVLSDGLENINLDGVTDIVIAGMGGETIVNILENYFWENSLENIRLILQPMSKPESLRKFLYNLGYMD